ncbi:MAG: hypothetical protein Q7T53_11355 [Deltaproteobacteria bacterium]|nr:hypothetical protein [Deltaproteobacteria bacterium]
MSKLIIPHLIALDSSTIGNVARDLYGSNQHNQGKARHLLDCISLKNLIPLVTWHHIEELLQHEDDAVIDNRICFIKNLPMVAWFDTVKPSGIIGTIMDIQAIELSWLISNPSTSFEEIIQKTKDKLLKFGTGRDLISIYDMTIWKQIMKRTAPIRQNRRREIASISHAKIGGSETKKPINFSNWQLRNHEEAEKVVETLKTNLEKDLVNRGDKKLSDHKTVAQEFIKDVYKDGLHLYHNRGDVRENFLKSFGLSPEEIPDKASIEDIGYAAIFRKKLKILAEILDINEDSFKTIKEDHCPSWLIWKELDKVLKSDDRTYGSNITDKYLAVLALYADFLIVDKRIHEKFNQVVRRNAVIKKVITNVVKLSDYGNISEALGCTE